jgi:hypothetical protein
MLEPTISLTPTPHIQWEFLNCEELALRWNLPESWIREQVRRRSSDPLPHVRFGKYVRFRWGSTELNEWAERRIVGSAKAVRTHRKEIIQ